MLSMYPACFYKEKEGGYSVIFPVLGIATCGDDINQAMSMAVDCLAGYLYELKLSKEEVPAAPDMDKIDIDAEYNDYESAFVNMVTVDVDEYAKKHFSAQDTSIWCGTVDSELTVKSYIVPGLGDAGDLAYGDKM